MDTSLALPTNDTDVVALTARARDVEAHANSLVLASDADVEGAAAFLVDVSKARQAAEKRRKFFVAPLNRHVKAINDLFGALAGPFVNAEATVKGKIAAYRREQQDRADAERRRLEAEERARAVAAEAARVEAEALALAAQESASTVNEDAAARAEFEARLAAVNAEDAREAANVAASAPAPARSVVTEAGRVTARKVWKFEVVNLDILPRVYVAANEKAIRAAVQAGAREIPGVRIFEAEDISVMAHA